MRAIQIESLLKEISPDSPSGDMDLRDDHAFLELENQIKSTPAYDKGEEKKDAKGPNWRKVQEDAVKLLARSHDLGVAVILTGAMVHTKGFEGLNSGLALIHGMIERFWNTLYPRLDPDDNDDPTQRSSILEQLSEEEFIGPLKRIPLCASRALGQAGYRDILLAKGELKPAANDNSPIMNLAQIEGAFKDTAPEFMAANRTAISASLKILADMETFLTEKIPDFGKRPKLGELRQTLAAMHDIMKSRTESGEPESTQSSDPKDTARAAVVKNDRSAEVIRDRGQVIRLLDQICAYYQRNEPASPVPLLLKRARRLVDKDFVEILEDLAPDSAKKIKSLISGAD